MHFEDSADTTNSLSEEKHAKIKTKIMTIYKVQRNTSLKWLHMKLNTQKYFMTNDPELYKFF